MSKFYKNDMFCVKCLLHDHFFRGGGSWAPDSCPICGGTETILWRNMGFLRHLKAKKLFDKWWNKEQGLDNNG